MEIKLKKLTLENFKGIKAFVLNANGNGTEIRGANATGKTTCSDGFHWLLFDKDSYGHSDFAIKTLDKSGQEAHNLDHTIEVELEIIE